jgi:predicted LPLAT superfamily acyltransferase
MSAPTTTAWTTMAERGSVFALRFLVGFYRLLGRRWCDLILYPTVTYFFLTSGRARRASRQFLERLHEAHGPLPGLETAPRWWHSYRHILSFSEGILDRFSFWARRYDGYTMNYEGREHLLRHVEEGRGAILLGAHLGSFDVLRVLAEEHDIPVNVLMFTANAERINSVFEQLDPKGEMRIIEIDPTSIRSIFEVRARLRRGEIVAILGDRAPLGGRDRVTWTPFLGKPAPFPQGPFLLSILLQAPVLFTVALRTARRHYEVYAEPMGEGEYVPRAEREKVLQERIEHFAARLEHHCQSAPFEWFNFYDFWQEGESNRG